VNLNSKNIQDLPYNNPLPRPGGFHEQRETWGKQAPW
jgi:hypothetical protein